jgi:N6-adenosine-specific RNA methylase IME4
MTVVPFPGRGFGLKFEGDRLPFHPLADLFPMIEGEELRALKDDIAANGLIEPITLFDGLILDGRNRFLACHGIAAERGWPDIATEDVTVRFVAYTGPDPLAFVIAKNLKRRHLNESQRAMAAAKLATLGEGRPSKETASIKAVSQANAADLLNIGRSAIQQAKKVRTKGTKALIKAVEDGKIAVSVAAKLAELPQKVQAKAVDDPTKAAHIAKKEAREGREAELAGKIAALPNRRYGVILADPEWRFETYSRETGMDRAADNHYPTSDLEEIKGRDIPSIAADDCVLFLWATAPMIVQALDVMSAWGFRYASQFIWAKDRIGTGFWNRNKHEILLIGTRGSPPAPAMGTQADSLVSAPIGRHSEKPAIFYEIIEAYFPTVPKIELNARRRRPRWDAWGLEAPQEAGE